MSKLTDADRLTVALLAAHDSLAARLAAAEGECHSLRVIAESNEKLHWNLVDLFDPAARGVSPLHFVEEQIKSVLSRLTAAESQLAERTRERDEFAEALCEAGGGFPFSKELWDAIGKARALASGGEETK